MKDPLTVRIGLRGGRRSMPRPIREFRLGVRDLRLPFFISQVVVGPCAGETNVGYVLDFSRNWFLYPGRVVCARLRQIVRPKMVDYISTGAVALALLAYLVYALLAPEKF